MQSLQRYTQARQKFAFCFHLGRKVTVGVRVGTRQMGERYIYQVNLAREKWLLCKDSGEFERWDLFCDISIVALGPRQIATNHVLRDTPPVA